MFHPCGSGSSRFLALVASAFRVLSFEGPEALNTTPETPTPKAQNQNGLWGSWFSKTTKTAHANPAFNPTQLLTLLPIPSQPN